MSEIEFLTLNEVAEKLKISLRTVQRFVQSGEIKAYKFGSQWRVEVDDFIEFLNKNYVNKEEK